MELDYGKAKLKNMRLRAEKFRSNPVLTCVLLRTNCSLGKMEFKKKRIVVLNKRPVVSIDLINALGATLVGSKHSKCMGK